MIGCSSNIIGLPIDHFISKVFLPISYLKAPLFSIPLHRYQIKGKFETFGSVKHLLNAQHSLYQISIQHHFFKTLN